MAKTRSAEKEEFWRLALAEQQASGMTIKAFCLQQGLAADTFSWWKRETKKRDQRRAGKHSDNRAKRHPIDSRDGDATIASDLCVKRIRRHRSVNHRSGFSDRLSAAHQV